VLTAAQIILAVCWLTTLLLERFHSKISPSVTYAKLDVMERKGWIKCKPHNGKTYSLTINL